MSKPGDIKARIVTLLNTLVPATLGEVISTPYNRGNLAQNIAAYPAAIVQPPSIESEYETNVDNMRTFRFEIPVIMRGEDITGTDAEDIREEVLNVFDNDPTLNGEAVGGLRPAVTELEEVGDVSASFVVFSVILSAKDLYRRT